MLHFTTIRDVSPHAQGYVEMFTLEQYPQFCRYVWEHGQPSAMGGVVVYPSTDAKAERLAEIELDGDEDDLAYARAVPTLDDLAAAFVRDVLHEAPSDYALGTNPSRTL